MLRTGVKQTLGLLRPGLNFRSTGDDVANTHTGHSGSAFHLCPHAHPLPRHAGLVVPPVGKPVVFSAAYPFRTKWKAFFALSALSPFSSRLSEALPPVCSWLCRRRVTQRHSSFALHCNKVAFCLRPSNGIGHHGGAQIKNWLKRDRAI